MRSPRAAPSASRPDTADRAASINIAGVGRVCVWRGGSVWIGRSSGRVAPHAHHAIQVSVVAGEDGGSFVLGPPGEADEPLQAAIVLPHRRHRFDGRGGTVAQVFVEPETALGHALRLRYAGRDITPLPLREIAGQVHALGRAFRGAAQDEAIAAAGRAVAEALAGAVRSPAPVSSRIETVIGRLAATQGAPMSLAQAAALVHISPSRLRHLFVEETGTTFRAYALWQRLRRAVEAMMAGASWTDAAHAAGFADSAHLSRTFRRMFGVSPNMLVRDR